MSDKKFKLSAISAAMMLASAGANAELIFSDYLEGASYNKAFELYNSGSDTINLADYKIVKYTNGDEEKPAEKVLSGMLPAGEVYVAAHADYSEALEPDFTDKYITNFNGDDPLRILKVSDNSIVDTLGKFGDIDFGKDVVLARKHDSLVPSGGIYDESQWEEKEKEDISGFGYKPGEQAEPPPVPDLLACGDGEILRISAVQGTASDSPLAGEFAQVQGFVTKVNGSEYYLQQPRTADDEEGASTAIRVYHYGHSVEVGDEVTVLGVVEERYDVTQLGDIEGTSECTPSFGPIEPVSVEMPEDGNFEAYESMYATLNPLPGDDAFYVSEIYSLNRYGDTVISSGGNLHKPTNKYPAGSDEAIAGQKKNKANRLTLDDGVSSQNPGTISYLPNLSFENPVRVGDRITGDLNGIITEGFGAYRLIPDGEVTVDASANPRVDYPESPAAGDLRISSFNVLNYFNGKLKEDGSIDWSDSDLGGARGADNAEEFARQSSKIVTALARMEADIVGILEIENDGWDEGSAIYDLVDRLNQAGDKPSGKEYGIVKTAEPYVGSDVIKVSLIYDTTVVEPVGEAYVLTHYPFDDITAKHRPPMIQTFKELSSGKEVTVVVNHFKSKGSDCDKLADPEDLFGQGNCNRQRVAASETLGKYLDANYNSKDVLIVGDINAYAKEDPVLVLTSDESNRIIEKSTRNESNEYSAEQTEYHLGYTNVVGENPVTYVFGGESGALDHALGSPSVSDKVTNIVKWSLNAFELHGQDYNEEYKDGEDIYGQTWEDRLIRVNNPFRSSDHDPVIVDVNLSLEEEEEEEEVVDDAGSFGFPMIGLGLLALFGLNRRKKQS